MRPEHTFCPACGGSLSDGAWPRRCRNCDTLHYLNPSPVAVLLQPVDGGLLTVRRNISPRRGELALPGGFIDYGESWQHAAARELQEETGVSISADIIEPFDVHSAPDGTLLVFGVAPAVSSDGLGEFESDHEVSEIVVIPKPRELAFSLHTRMAQRWFRNDRP